MFDPKTHILVVDDMLTMRKLVIKSCKEMGFTEFTEAKDGREAWDKLSTSKPPIGLIISDWNMPNASGLDLLKRVRGETRFKQVPFVLVTAEAEKEQIFAAVKAGVSGYIVKPFTTDILKEKFEAIHSKLSGN